MLMLENVLLSTIVKNRHRLFHYSIPRTTFFFLSQSTCLLLNNKRRLTRRNKNKNMQGILNLFYLAFAQ
jgi:hypothetical protein